MTRTHIMALLALVAVVPAAAVGANSFLSAQDDTPCFATGNVGYRLTGRRYADVTVRIDNAAARPDVTIQTVDDPGLADFVLAEGVETSGICSGVRAVRTIRVDAEAREADLTIALRAADTGARYKIYARSPHFTAQEAAALFAVMVQTGRRTARAAREDDITGALTRSSPRSSDGAGQ